MRKVRCYDCGRSYDYDEDGFCPNCGAFNQPQRGLRISADGSVIRVDGLNEINHTNSFVHRELHEEKRERRKASLDKSIRRFQRTDTKTGSARFTSAATVGARTDRRSRKTRGNPVSLMVWIVIMIIIANILPRVLRFF